ncbi:HYC_CC_PP family protein [Spongiivirga citrea]|uniref:Secreted protein n=1 Tax=Spongiivirga citrea TaxID=1481457 RepID=A0A6M0CH42_9FLAO|nr:hypothetical protein [Spongiivirga citrea]NER16273.1 hypothetical protein [Spongiivirga citrea]
MKRIFHKIMSLIMAFVVLFSTMSFTIDMHYCGDTLVDTAIFKKAENCGMKMRSASSSDCSIEKKNCCSDEQLLIDGQNELKTSLERLTYEQQQIVVSFVLSYIDLFEGFDGEINSFREYKPPLIVRQIFKIDETYLI